MDEWTLCLFVTHLAQSVRPATIKVYLSAIRALHIEQGFQDPLVDFSGNRYWYATSSNQWAKLGLPDSQLQIRLLLIFKALDFSKHDHIMFWEASKLAYFGFLCSSEFTMPNLSSFSSVIHLSVADLAIDSYDAPTCLRMHLKASKTDPRWQRHPPLRTIHSLMAYLQLRGNGAGPLFLLQDGGPLSRALLTDWLRRILTAAGGQGSFSSHSFRIGAATVAACNGIPDHLIKELGRWTSHAYQIYIHSPSESLAQLSSQLS